MTGPAAPNIEFERGHGVAGLFAAFALLAATPVKVAVLELQATGVDPAVAKNLSEYYAAAIDNLGCCKIITTGEISTMLGFERQKQLLGCTDDSACLAEIGGALGVDKLASGSIGKLGSVYLINLKLVDMSKASVDGRFTEQAGGKVEKLLEVVQKGVYKIFAEVIRAQNPEPELAAVEAPATEPELELALAPVAPAPAKPPAPKPAPAKPTPAPEPELELELAPIAAAPSKVEPAPAAATQPTKPAEPKPAEGGGGIIGIIALGAGAAAAAAGGAFGYFAVEAGRAAVAARDRTTWDQAAASAKTNAMIANAAWVAAGVAGAAGVVMIVMKF
jgi:hypothetical protein